MKSKVIIDTDPGKDDALAILLLTRSSKIDLLAVTTVAGNTNIQNVSNNAQFILNLVGSNVPIFTGAKKPLKKKLYIARVHGASGLSGVKVNSKVRLSDNAPEQTYKLLKKYPNQINIIAIGPLTNIARLLTIYPDSAKLVKQFIIMGGAIEVAGNMNRVAEFNFFVDPHAAKIVMNSPVKKTLIPLDICNRTPLFLNDFNKLKGSALFNPIMKMMKPYIKAIKKFEGQNGALVYDALAAYYLINPKPYQIKPMDIRIETKGELTEGMSVADRRSWGTHEENINVVTDLDRGVFLKDFLELLN